MIRAASFVLAALLASALLGTTSAQAAERWVGSWATSQQIPEERNALPAATLNDATLRQTVRLSIGGSSFRVRLSNAFGTAPLSIKAAHVARPVAPGSDTIDPASDRALYFSGAADVVIPAGAEYVSDPVPIAVAAGADLAITLYFETAPARQTSHPGSRTTSYLLRGNHIAALALPGAEKIDHWFHIAGVDVTSASARAVSVIGDSITDGRGSTTNGNDRWTDALARRFAAAKKPVGVLNHGIGGGRLLLDELGPNAMARFNRDVLAQPGIRWLIVFEGINDIGTFDPDGSKPKAAHDALVRQITIAYAQMAAKARAAGIKIYGATITPFLDCTAYNPKPINEADRIAVNKWIRTAGNFDGVIDFDAAVRDPARPDHLLPAYDTGDHLHLSPAGYRAMADATPLSLFQ